MERCKNEKCDTAVSAEETYCRVQCKRAAAKRRKRAKKRKQSEHYKAYLKRADRTVFAPVECDTSCNSSWS